MRRAIDIWTAPSAARIGLSVKEFLCNLRGPAWIDVPGRDRRRTRVLATLLHGNEPSGVKALFNWLGNPARPAPLTNLSCFVCSVEAALTEPEFSHRYLPGAPDMNRCFRPPFDSPNGRLAEQILRRIRTLKPEAVVDIHNTSGSGPDFAVTTTLDPAFVALAKNFSTRLILTELKLGALMEAEVGCPIVTLECGGGVDLSADQTALAALNILAGQDNLFDSDHLPAPDIYRHPLRFEIRSGVSICYAEAADPACDVTLASDIEKHNFGITPAGEFLGWVGPAGLDYFTARDDQGQDIKDHLFRVEDHRLYTRLPLKLFMVTPRPEIARKDCLFYLAKPEAVSPKPDLIF